MSATLGYRGTPFRKLSVFSTWRTAFSAHRTTPSAYEKDRFQRPEDPFPTPHQAFSPYGIATPPFGVPSPPAGQLTPHGAEACPVACTNHSAHRYSLLPLQCQLSPGGNALSQPTDAPFPISENPVHRTVHPSPTPPTLLRTADKPLRHAESPFP